MENRASFLVIGSFVLATVAGIVAFVLWLAQVDVTTARTEYRIAFEGAVTGLQEASAVRLRGVPFGRVTSIRIDPDDLSRVLVTIETPAQPRLTSDMVASLESQGITGLSFIQLSGDGSGTPLTEGPDGQPPEIPSRGSSLSDLLVRAPELMENLIALTESANAFLSPENQQAFAQILSNTAAISDDLRAATDGVGALSANANALVSETRAQVAALSRALEDEVFIVTDEVAQTAASFRTTAQAITDAANQVNGLVGENRTSLRDFTGQGLYEMTQLMSELRALVTNLNSVATRIERDPRDFFLRGAGSGRSTP